MPFNLQNPFRPKQTEQSQPLFLDTGISKTKLDNTINNGVQKIQNFADKITKPITNFFVPNLGKKQKELGNLKDKAGNLFIEGNDLQVQRDALLNKKSITPLVPANKSQIKPKKAIITVYNPVPGQTDSSPNTGSFMTKMEFGDIAVGNRKEHQIAKDKFFKSGEDTFITIPELSQIKTPYGQGVFRVRDTMAKRFYNQGKLDVFIPEGMNDLESLVRHVPKGSYY